MDRVHMPVLPFFPTTGGAYQDPLTDSFTAVEALPANVQIVSLNWWNQSSVLVRLAHQFGINEDVELSKPVTIELATLFKDRHIKSVDERGITGTISRTDVLQRRIPWRVEGDDSSVLERATATTASTVAMVILGPLQIRTFLIEFSQEQSVVLV